MKLKKYDNGKQIWVHKYIEKSELEQVIIDIMNNDYVHKDKIRDILLETEYDENFDDYRKRYLDFYHSINNLL